MVDNGLMRVALFIIVALLTAVQVELWLGKGGLPRVMSLRSQVESQQQLNAQALARNERLAAEVRDLREGLEMVEEKARTELGMVKPDEIYVQLTSQAPARTTSASAAASPSSAQ